MADTITTGKPYRRKSDNLWVVPINLGTGADGKRKRVTVARKLQRDAVAAAKEKVAELESGVIHGGGKTTVEAWLEYWLKHIVGQRKYSPNTVQSYRARVASIVPELGRARLDRLTARHIREMHTAHARAGLAVSTSALVHTVLEQALDDAVKEGLIGKNPAEAVEKPTGDAELRPALTAEQSRHLIQTCLEANDRMTWRFSLALLTGLRQGEALGLTWDRVDFDAGTIDLSWALIAARQLHGCTDDPDGPPTCGAAKNRPRDCPQVHLAVPRGYRHIPLSGPLVLGSTKTAGSRRVVPLPAMLMHGLREHYEHTPTNRFNLVWTTSAGNPIHQSTDHRNWRRALLRAGLPLIPLHSARHTAATLLQELRVDEAVRMRILGHNSQAVHRRYAHIDLDATRAAIESFGDTLGIGA